MLVQIDASDERIRFGSLAMIGMRAHVLVSLAQEFGVRKRFGAALNMTANQNVWFPWV